MARINTNNNNYFFLRATNVKIKQTKQKIFFDPARLTSHYNIVNNCIIVINIYRYINTTYSRVCILKNVNPILDDIFFFKQTHR